MANRKFRLALSNFLIGCCVVVSPLKGISEYKTSLKAALYDGKTEKAAKAAALLDGIADGMLYATMTGGIGALTRPRKDEDKVL